MSSTENLFRTEAIKALREPTRGRPVCTVPLSWTVLTLLLLLLTAVALICAPNLSWHRTETARGWLLPESGTVSVSTDTMAVVNDLTVGIGDPVSAGEPLLQLRRDRVLDDGRLRGDEDYRRVENELNELEQQLRLTKRRFNLETASAESQLSAAQDGLASLWRQRSSQDERVRLAIDKLERLQQAGNSIASWRRLDQREAVAQQRLQNEQLQQSIAVARRDAERIHSILTNLPVQADLELSRIRAAREELRRQLLDIEAGTRIQIVAPIEGTVADISINPGDTAFPGQTLMTIVPPSGPMVAELYVSPASIPHLHAGDTVALTFDAYPLQRFGTSIGLIESVASFVTAPKDAPVGIPFRDAAYKVTVELEETNLELHAGMTLMARLVLDERDLVDWLLQPIRTSGDR